MYDFSLQSRQSSGFEYPSLRWNLDAHSWVVWFANVVITKHYRLGGTGHQKFIFFIILELRSSRWWCWQAWECLPWFVSGDFLLESSLWPSFMFSLPPRTAVIMTFSNSFIISSSLLPFMSSRVLGICGSKRSTAESFITFFSDCLSWTLAWVKLTVCAPQIYMR